MIAPHPRTPSSRERLGLGGRRCLLADHGPIVVRRGGGFDLFPLAQPLDGLPDSLLGVGLRHARTSFLHQQLLRFRGNIAAARSCAGRAKLQNGLFHGDFGKPIEVLHAPHPCPTIDESRTNAKSLLQAPTTGDGGSHTLPPRPEPQVAGHGLPKRGHAPRGRLVLLRQLLARIVVRTHGAEPFRDFELRRIELRERPLDRAVRAVAAVAGLRARERRGGRP
jgi:hypothetical protein